MNQVRRHGWYLLLALASAVCLLPTYQYKAWTGYRYANEIGFALAMTSLLLFAIILRRSIKVFPAMLANLVGIVAGAGAAKIVNGYAKTGSFKLASLAFSIFAISALVALYFRAMWQQGEIDNEEARLKSELEAFAAMTPSEQVAQLEAFQKVDIDLRMANRSHLLAAILITFGALLSFTTLFLRSPGPLSITITVVVMIGAILLWWLYFARLRLTKNEEETTRSR